VRLTTKTAYALAALYDLACHANGSRRGVQAKEIAARQAVPLRYLEQILRELRQAGFVEAKRGPAGGYALARPAPRLRLSEVVEALEAPVASGVAAIGAASAPGLGAAGQVLRELQEKVAALYAQVTVQDLLDRAGALGAVPPSGEPQMYFI
jgi:Rrf2 family transcriptional regulator, iron-sulfur cluster assembly transcription factor